MRTKINNVSIYFLTAALIEYKDAVVWYKERSLKASENFVQQVKDKIDKICHSPFRYPKIYKHFRETPLRKYPYSLVYFFMKIKSWLL
jgi:hypothetical protein